MSLTISEEKVSGKTCCELVWGAGGRDIDVLPIREGRWLDWTLLASDLLFVSARANSNSSSNNTNADADADANAKTDVNADADANVNAKTNT